MKQNDVRRGTIMEGICIRGPKTVSFYVVASPLYSVYYYVSSFFVVASPSTSLVV